MKKIVFTILMILAMAGCSKDNPEEQAAVYSLLFGYSPAAEVQSRLSYDAKLVETVYFYEHDADGNKIVTRVWNNPRLNEEKEFTADGKTSGVVIFYEVRGTAQNGDTIADSMYFQEVLHPVGGRKITATFTATTKTSQKSPI